MSLAVFTSIIMVAILVVLLVMGASISIAIGLSSAAAMLCMLPPDISFITSAQRIFSGANSFSLIAIPFFILAGNIMNNGGIAIRLVNVAKVLAGRMPGALAQSNVVANMMFGAISGSGAAAAAAIGGTMGPLEEQEGYDPQFSAAVNIASAPTGMLIPPSNLMIVYSTVAGSVSVAALFVAGYVPGILWGLGVMALAAYFAKKRGYVAQERVTVKEALHVILDAIPSLLLIVIIIGGILGGVFTATEGSAIAVIYATVLSLIYRSIKPSDLPGIILESAKMTGIITFMIGLSSIMSWGMSFTGIPDLIGSGILALTGNKYVILIMMNIIILIVGTFMDPTPAILIFTPIFLPVCESFGISPIHFGIMMSYNLCIGTITPPVGSILFTGCKVGKVSIESVMKELLPYFLVILVGLLLVTYIPAVSMTLPTLGGLV
ncbi:MAG TPA: TRAP transporter large permease [Candidatus Ventrimonas merdavium]|nr:TRAP transporter large permease [Candidatus Ventrimonas merdavium]